MKFKNIFSTLNVVNISPEKDSNGAKSILLRFRRLSKYCYRHYTGNLIFIIWIAFMMGLLLCAAAKTQPYQYIPADNKQLDNRGKFLHKHIEIFPSDFLRGFDPVTIFFAKPVGPGSNRAEDYPEKYIKVKPKPHGEFRWIDNKTLQFKPTQCWPPLKKYIWDTKKEEVVLYTMMEAPVSVNPADNSTNLKTLQTVTLTFKNQIEPEKLKKMIRIELRELPGLTNKNSRWLTAKEFSVKFVEKKNARHSSKYIVSLNQILKSGYKMILHLKLCLENNFDKNLKSYTFSTREPFRIKSAGPYGSVFPITADGVEYSSDQALKGNSLDKRFILSFSSKVDKWSFTDIKNLIQFTPVVDNLKYYINGNKIILSGQFKDEVQYKTIINPVELYDENNRKLDIKGNSELYFYFPARQSFIKWEQSKCILERYGYQKIPMQERGEKSIDLRIYKIDPLSRRFMPFVNQPLIIDETLRPPGPGEEPRERAYITKHIQMLGSPLISRIVDLPENNNGKYLRFGLDVKNYLMEISGYNQPGTYLLGYRRLNGDKLRHYIRIQVTDLCVSTIEEKNGVTFLVTSLNTGEPVENATIMIEGLPYGYKGYKYVSIIRGNTDENGMFHWSHDKRIRANLTRLKINKDDDYLMLDLKNSPPKFVNNHWFRSNNKWLNWITQRPNTKRKIDHCAHIITERPVYKPDEEVHIKAYIRDREKGKINLHLNGDFIFYIRGPGNKKWKFPVKSSDLGSFYKKFNEKKKPTGIYRITLRDEKRHNYRDYGSTSFRVEAYKIPRFEVHIHGKDYVSMDKPFSMDMTADYYAGGKVIDEPAHWRVSQFPYVHIPKLLKGYIYSSDNRYSRDRRFKSTGTLERKSRTDSSGHDKILIDPCLEIDGKPRLYLFEATVTGADGQTVTATRKVKALPAFNIGLKVNRYIKKDKIISPEIVCLDVNDTFLPGKELTVRLLKREWHSHLQETNFIDGKSKYISEIVDLKINEQTIVSGIAPYSLNFPVEEAGIYILEVEGRDSLGRMQTIRADVFVNGDEQMTWEKPVTHVFKTVPLKGKYSPGETAVILLKSPFQSARALGVIETPEEIKYKMIEIKNGKAEFSLFIKDNYVPRLPVHFLLWCGRRNKKDSSGSVFRQDLYRPQTLASTTWLKIKPVNNRISLSIEHPEKALPGQQTDFKINMKDSKGKPLSGEVTLWLVDQAVLALGKEKSINPLPKFITGVTSKISIKDTRNKIIGNIPLNEHPAGDGTTTKSKKIMDKVTVRKNFKTTPYFNDRIMIDDSGCASLKIPLPDNLTNFKIRAMAISGTDKFGYYKSQIAIRLPVIVQTALPRFIRIGDRFTAGGIGRVVEGSGGNGHCEIQTQGLSIVGDTFQHINWKPGIAKKIYFPFHVETPGFTPDGDIKNDKVTIKMAVVRDSDNAMDAFEVELPLKDDRKKIYRENFLTIKPGEKIKFPDLKDSWRKNTLRQKLLICNQMALIKMVAGLDYLIRYPYGCTEQKVSRSFPAVALQGIFKSYNFDNIKRETIDAAVYETLRYLKKTQNRDGFYSYWPGGNGYVYLTAYVVEFLLATKKAGYTFDNVLLSRSISALKRALRRDYSGFIDGSQLFERSEALYALGLAGEFDRGYADELYHNSKYMSLYNVSKLLLACKISNYNKPKVINALKDELWNSTVFKLRFGKEIFSGVEYRTNSWGGLINSSEIQTLSGIIRALFKSDSRNPKLQQMVAQLVRLGKDNGWGNTNTNASALLSLRDVLQSPDKSLGKHIFKINSNGKNHRLVLDKKNPIVELQSGGHLFNSIYRKPNNDTRILFVRYNRSYIPESSGDMVASENKGFVVSRQLIKVSKSDTIPDEKVWIEQPGKIFKYKIGDIIEEHIEVVNSKKRHFVVVSAPLAAGFEPMNPNLAVSEPEARPSGNITLSPSYSKYYDDQVDFCYETLPKGTYHFYYRVKAMTEGSFVQPAAYAMMMYKEAVRGNSPGTRIEISSKDNIKE